MFTTGTTTNGIVPTIDLNGNNNDGWGGDGAWWIVLLIIAFMGGGFGMGGFGGMGMGGMFLPWMLLNNQGEDTNHIDATVQRGFDQASTNSQLSQIQSDICQGNAAINLGVQQGFSNLNTQLCSSFDGVTAGINNLGYNLQTSLLNVNNLIDGVKYENAQNTSQIIQAQNANTQRIVDLMNQNTMQDLRDQLTSARGELSQAQQTSDIVNQLQPVARPAYVVQSPYQSQMYGCSGCGCNMA